MIFKRGDPVRVHCTREDIVPPLVGRHAGTVEKRITWLMRKFNSGIHPGADYLVEVEGRPGMLPGGTWSAPAWALTPRRDGEVDDTAETTEWRLCEWRPKKVTEEVS